MTDQEFNRWVQNQHNALIREFPLAQDALYASAALFFTICMQTAARSNYAGTADQLAEEVLQVVLATTNRDTVKFVAPH